MNAATRGDRALEVSSLKGAAEALRRIGRLQESLAIFRQLLSFEGDTGPYCQYQHARIASIVRKA